MMPNSYPFAELTTEEIEVIQELENVLSQVKGRLISLIAYDLGENMDEDEVDEEIYVSGDDSEGP